MMRKIRPAPPSQMLARVHFALSIVMGLSLAKGREDPGPIELGLGRGRTVRMQDGFSIKAHLTELVDQCSADVPRHEVPGAYDLWQPTQAAREKPLHFLSR